MKKLKIVWITAVCLLTFIIIISAKYQQEPENKSICKSYKDSRFYGVEDFINMDLGLMGYFPTKEHWEKINKKIKNVPIDSLRYIDSLDIKTLADTIYVKVYSQNYVYRSWNMYKIAKNENNNTDTLMIFNMNIDIKMKDIIEDAETFRLTHYTLSYTIKQNIINVDKRVIFNKMFR